MIEKLVDCSKCIKQGSTSCPLLNGEIKENIIKYQCPLFEALPNIEENISKELSPLESLNWIRGYEWANPKIKDKLDSIEVILKAFNSIKDLIELVDDEHGYGITLKGLYTFEFISKKTYYLLKEALK